MKSHRFMYLMGCITISLAMVLLLVYLFWAFYPYKIADVKSPAPVITKQVKAGEALFYEFESNVYCECEVTEVNRMLVNGVHYIMNKTHPPTPKVGYVRGVVASNTIPHTIIPDFYKMQFCAKHRVNPIRNINVCWETEMFEVIE